MTAANIEDLYTLSPMQEGMLFHTLYAPHSGMYIIQMSCTLQGELNRAAFKRAWQQAIARHAILRTSFYWQEMDKPHQAVYRHVDLPFEEHDWSALAPGEQRDRLASYIDADRRRGFELEHAPLMRLTLIRLAEHAYQFIWTAHHLLLDGWCQPMLFKEVLEFYTAFCQGQAIRPRPVRPYSDYIAWLRRQDLSKAEAFWRQSLKGFTAPTPLVVDRAQRTPGELGATYYERQSRLPAETAEALQSLARQHGLTLNTFIQAAWALLLSRYSGEPDIVFGAIVSGRPATLPGVESMIGLFINTLPVRARLAPTERLLPWLKRLQDQQLALLEYQYTPLVQIQGWSELPRGLPLFESIVVFENYPMDGLASGEKGSRLAIQGIQSIDQSNYPLTVVALPGLVLKLICDRRRFDPETADRMSGHLQTLLASMAADPARRLADLPMLTEGERRQLLEEWNKPRPAFAPDRCIHQLFEAQVERTPNAVAVVFPDPGKPAGQAQLTYRELNQRANQVAHYLRSLGVAPETLVGICVERSLEMVVGLLGILKAGGAYVPLDPAYPPERLAFMLEDSGASVLLTATTEDRGLKIEDSHAGAKEKLSSILYPLSSIRPVVDLGTDWEQIARQPETNPESGVRPENLAYVIYTSGSTGRPKGALVTHYNVVRLFQATQDWFHFSQDDVWTLFHSYAFDFTVWELWGALCYGGRLVVAPYWVSRSPEAFYDLLVSQQVTMLNQIPSAFRQLIQIEERLGQPGELALRYVIFGGEALELNSLRPWFERHGDQAPRLVNMYGITETTVHVTYRPITLADLNASAGSVIGSPIPDLRLYVLDAHGQPAPIGVPGELYVGGAGLARGYLHQPALTAERFVPNPFLKIEDGGWRIEDGAPGALHPPSSILHPPSSRLYRTGDLGRYLPNGDIEYLGRIDHQVKVRGFRIELEEIEAALRQHPAVRECLVVARTSDSSIRDPGERRGEDQPGHKRLVAYVIPVLEDGGWKIEDGDRGAIGRPSSILHPPSSIFSELRGFLESKLPGYMVPAAFVTLDAWPRTPSGKIDRQALPALDGARPDLEELFVAPRTAVERILAETWAGVLGLERVGVRDNFFALGGDSILGIQVMARAREQGWDFSLQQLFQHQTIEALAAVGTPLAGQAPSDSIQPFSLLADQDRHRLPADVEDAYPLARLQVGMLFHSEYNPQSTIYHNITSTRLRGPFDGQALHAALQQLARRHPVLRTSFDLTSFSEPLQLVHRAVEIPLSIEDLRQYTPDQQRAALRAWLDAERARKFDWTRAPLIRFSVHRLDQRTFQLSFAEHHAILDGWSVASMLTELFQVYLSLLGADTPPLPPPPALAFSGFVAAERNLIEQEQARAYWRAKLAGGEIGILPRWPSAARQAAHQVRMHPVPIPPERSAALKRLARSAGVSIKSVLFAAHVRVLSLLTGQQDVITGLVANGRPEGPDGERVLGLFLNTLPLRLALTGGAWIDLIRAAFDAERELLPFRQYPLVELQKLMGGQPLFESAFNYIHFHVYQNVQGFRELQVEENNAFQETNFTLLANFAVDASSGHVNLSLDYDATELSEQQIVTIGEAYAHALEAMAQTPTARYERCSLLSAAQRQLLHAWNATRTSFPEGIDRSLHSLIEAQALRTPAATALVAPGTPSMRLSYHELNARANQLAHELRGLGVGPEVPVAICAERSVELVIGLLGILKAGGAYLPLDPSYPSERLQYMLEDAQVAVVLTATTDHRPPTAEAEDGGWKIKDGRAGAPEMPSSILHPPSSILTGTPSPLHPFTPSGVVVVDLVADWPTIARQPATNPDSGVQPQNLAYIIYTSGSTGRPKGAMNTHRGIVNRLLWMQATYQLTPNDAVLQKTPYSFDVSVWEFFWPLLAGASLVLARPGGHRDSAYMVRLIAEQRITTLHFVPPMLQAVVEEPGLEQCTSLKRVICSGEALPYALQERCLARLPHAELHNLYGPTEAAVDVSAWACQRQDARQIVPIGRPIANTQLYVLDKQMELVPIGVAGELYIGGVQLARGYLARPELTAERFVPNPFLRMEDRGSRMEEGTPGALDPPSSILHPRSSRLYRTGDLARYLPDGAIEYLGRLDHQVKIHGFRIELGEIEAALRQHEAVREAVVVAREDRPGAKRLVAYVVPSQEQRTKNKEQSSQNREPRAENREQSDEALDSQFSILNSQFSIQELRSFLKDRLPEYMVPSTFVALEAMPLTPNGKLDRRALPLPDAGEAEMRAPFVAPQTPAELILAEVWAAVLGLDRVGVQDNFFALGGDSIHSTRVVAKARERGLHFSLEQFFQHPTIQALAAQLSLDQPEQSAPEQAAPEPIQQFGLLSLEDQARLRQLHARTSPLNEREV